jgi:hypothetical protein
MMLKGRMGIMGKTTEDLLLDLQLQVVEAAIDWKRGATASQLKRKLMEIDGVMRDLHNRMDVHIGD